MLALPRRIAWRLPAAAWPATVSATLPTRVVLIYHTAFGADLLSPVTPAQLRKQGSDVRIGHAADDRERDCPSQGTESMVLGHVVGAEGGHLPGAKTNPSARQAARAGARVDRPWRPPAQSAQSCDA